MVSTALSFETHRPVVMGMNGMVASAHPLASQAGLRMLMEGGNAVDAAIATATVLGVVEPGMSGLGGDGFALIYFKGRNELRCLNGTGAAPLAATREVYRDGMPRVGIRSVSVPGLVDMLIAAHERYGTLPLTRSFEPAIHYAEAGFPVTHVLARGIAQTQTSTVRPLTHASFRKTFLIDGRPPQPGELLRQPKLAETLRLIAEGGREAFYRGPIARSLVVLSRREDGLLSEEDFARHRSRWDEPIGITYRGYEVYEAPPNSTGIVLLEELKIVEQFDIASMGPCTAESVHLLVEAKKLAFADRERYIGDPEWVEIPVQELLSEEYARQQAKRIDLRRAAEDVAPGIPGRHDTTYFCVVDREGNAVSWIQSLNMAFGSGVVDEATGILLNNRMAYWHLEEGHPNRLEPGKRVRHTINPPMVFKDGALFMVFGTPGSDLQVQTNLQLATHIIDFGLNPQQAVEAPRWSSYINGTTANWPHTAENELRLEDRFPEEVFQGLRARGHPVVAIGPWAAGTNPQVIMVHPTSGALMGGSDPRRDSYAVAW